MVGFGSSTSGLRGILLVALLCWGPAGLWVGCSSERPSAERPSAGQGTDAASSRANRTIHPQARKLLLQGEQAFQQGRYQRALALADSAATYAPGKAVIPFFRGSIYRAQNRPDAAQRAYRQVLQLDARYPEAHMRMGDIERQQGNLREALRWYRQEKAIASRSPLFVKMGEVYARLGKADSARMAYEHAIALDSTNARAHMLFGQFLEETGHLKEALAHSRKALRLRPDAPNYQFAVGAQLFRLGQAEEAVTYLTQAADARLLHYPAQYNAGQALLRLGRDEEANYYLARADSARWLMDQISLAQEATARAPDTVENWLRLGHLYRRAGELQEALQALQRAARIAPSNLAVQRTIGQIMLARGNTKGAIQRFQAILSADRTQVQAWLYLGLAYATIGNCERAQQSWKMVLKYDPGHAAAQNYLSGLCQYTAQ